MQLCHGVLKHLDLRDLRVTVLVHLPLLFWSVLHTVVLRLRAVLGLELHQQVAQH